MSEWHEIQKSRFKEQINFDEMLRRVDHRYNVVADWPDPRTFFKIASNWELIADKLYFEAGGVERIWVFATGEARLSLKIFVSSMGPEVVLQRLVNIATNTMMMEVPFQKSSIRVGDLALVPKGELKNLLIWAYKNVLFQIEVTDYDISVLTFAQAVQAFAERHIVLNAESYFPRIDRIAIEPKSIRVGNKVKVTVILVPGSKIERLVADFDIEGKSLSAVAQNEWDFLFDALEPGASRISIGIADRLNILSVSKTVTVQVADN